jgi:hypothetical protein
VLSLLRAWGELTVADLFRDVIDVLVYVLLTSLAGIAYLIITGKWKEPPKPDADWSFSEVYDSTKIPQHVKEQAEELKRQGAPEVKYQVFSIVARKAPVRECKAVAKFDGAETHLLWEGTGLENYVIAKDAVTLQAGEAGNLIVWYAGKQADGRLTLRLPTVNRPQVNFPIGPNLPPLGIELTLLGEHFSKGPFHFVIYRESWETLRGEMHAT